MSYCPGGMMMPARKYSIANTNYRYGFDGQESDKELSENIYSAQNWEYDSRIGRRWNTDPVVKIWQSPYETFRNNPVVYIDPDGDDDIFDRHGKFLFSTAQGNAIRIINDKTTIQKAQSNPTANTMLITKFSYFPANRANRVMLASIATHYASEVGINENVNVADVAKKNSSGLAFYSSSYNIAVYNGKINPQATDAYNLMNSFVHEKVHEDDPATAKPLKHTSAILTQIDDKTFDKTTRPFKNAMGTYAATLLTEALQNYGAKVDDINSKISQFNKSKLGKYSTLSYDAKSNSVRASAIDEEIIVKLRPKK